MTWEHATMMMNWWDQLGCCECEYEPFPFSLWLWLVTGDQWLREWDHTFCCGLRRYLHCGWSFGLISSAITRVNAIIFYVYTRRFYSLHHYSHNSTPGSSVQLVTEPSTYSKLLSSHIFLFSLLSPISPTSHTVKHMLYPQAIYACDYRYDDMNTFSVLS